MEEHKDGVEPEKYDNFDITDTSIPLVEEEEEVGEEVIATTEDVSTPTSEAISTPTTLPTQSSTSTTIPSSASTEEPHEERKEATNVATKEATPSTARSQYQTPMLHPPPPITIPNSSDSIPVTTPTPLSTVQPFHMYPSSSSTTQFRNNDTKTPAPAQLKEPPKLPTQKHAISRIPAYLEYQQTPAPNTQTPASQTQEEPTPASAQTRETNTSNLTNSHPKPILEHEVEEKEEDLKVDYWDDGSECSLPSFARRQQHSHNKNTDDQSETSSIASRSSYTSTRSKSSKKNKPQNTRSIPNTPFPSLSQNDTIYSHSTENSDNSSIKHSNYASIKQSFKSKDNESDIYSVATTSHTHTDVFSAVSGAQGSLLNYKHSKRRNRPWDSADENGNDEKSNDKVVNENTYLLSDADYGKLQQAKLRQQNNKKDISMNMRWSGGFFSSTNPSATFDNEEEEEITVHRERGLSDDVKSMEDLLSIQTMTRSTFPSIQFTFVLGICMALHFFAMMLHDLFLQYISWRRNDYNDDYPPVWVSSNGFLSNPLIGPGASTLFTFGAIEVHHLLYYKSIWRVFTSMTVCTSIPQLMLSLSILKFTHVKIDVNNWGFLKSMGIFGGGCIGGVFFSILTDVSRNYNGVVGLHIAGIASLMIMGWLERIEIVYKEMKRDRMKQQHMVGARSKASWCGGVSFEWRKRKRMMLPIFLSLSCLLVQYVISYFPYTSYNVINGGLIIALAIRLLSISSLYGNKNGDEESVYTTEERHHDDDAHPPAPPPPPPYSAGESSAGYDSMTHTSTGAGTPIMRRSIMASPDDDDLQDDGMGYGGGFVDPSLGSRRRRFNTASTVNTNNHDVYYTPNAKPQHGMGKQYKQTIQTCSLVMGVVIALSMMVIPITLVATEVIEKPSYDMVQASIHGFVTMHRLYVPQQQEEENSNQSSSVSNPTCAEAYIPISLQHRAKRLGKMKAGYCDDWGYRCLMEMDVLSFGSSSSSSWLSLFSMPRFEVGSDYETEMKVYVLASSGGSCAEYNEDSNNEEEGGEEDGEKEGEDVEDENENNKDDNSNDEKEK